MYVEGYDTSQSGYDLVMSMEKHFGSCGEVLHVYIPGYCEGKIPNRFALMYLRGEGAEEKASKLNGSCMGGHKLVVAPYPFHATRLEHKFALMRKEDNEQAQLIYIQGYDTSLPLDYVERILYEEVGLYGEVVSITICEEEENKAVLRRTAFVTVRGIDALERLLHLRGCDRRGLENIKLTGVARPDPDEETLFPVFVECSPSRTWVSHEDPNLPEPWKDVVDDGTGLSYFWNTETNVTQYQRPSSETNVTPPLLQ
ncbi:unnamed protein product [Microthlaspi erraticum]|uniref:WW domain-containing protein n=1 Tax=Microthlaspi erraticum TaxID=1685480 RepID=A0A6D2KC86_9BRAS|nr:unnamed protein product [Microthlaspi erraticum]